MKERIPYTISKTIENWSILCKDNNLEIVPISFNINAFAFGAFYFIYKGLHKYAITYILSMFIVYFGLRSIQFVDVRTLNVATSVIYVVVNFMMGKLANSIIEKHLIDHGFEKLPNVVVITETKLYFQQKNLKEGELK